MKFYDELESITDDKEYIDFCVNNWIIPTCKEILNKRQDIHTLVVAGSQYYNDEASDACHIEFYPSSTNFSTWENLFNIEINSFVKNDYEENYLYSMSSYDEERRNFEEKTLGGQIYLDNEERFIECFSPFCNSGEQGEPTVELYQPLLVVERDGDDFKVRNLMNLIRVWK